MKNVNTKIRHALVLALGLTSSYFAVAQSAPAVMVAAAVTSASTKVTTAATQACHCFSVQVVGQGPAIILIPGLASSGEVWQSTVAALKPHYQLHILTLAGFAGVQPLPMDAWGQGYLVTQQHAILQYIATQKLQKPMLVGHSLGGYLALALAARAPEQIGAVVNVDGLPALGALFAANAAPSNTEKNPNTQNQSAAKTPAPTRFDPMLMAKGMARDPQWHQRIAQDMSRSDGMTSGRVMGELMQADLRKELSHLSVPVLTLGALQNGAPFNTPEKVQANYEAQFTNAPTQYHSFAFAKEAKHFIMADEPEWMNTHIQSFAQQHTVQVK